MIHVVIDIQIAKSLLVPLMVGIHKAIPHVDEESRRDLLKRQSYIWECMEESKMDDDGVDITAVFSKMQIELGRMCALAFNEESQEDQERAWDYLVAGFRVFDVMVSGYLKKASDRVKELKEEGADIDWDEAEFDPEDFELSSIEEFEEEMFEQDEPQAVAAKRRTLH